MRKLFDMIAGVIIPAYTVGSLDAMKHHESLIIFKRTLSRHVVSVYSDSCWPSLIDIGECMYKAENKPVTVSIETSK